MAKGTRMAKGTEMVKGADMVHDHAFFDALNCPNQVTWANDIKKMFTSVDIAHMISAPQHIHLDSYQSVKIWAVSIYTAVKAGTMPRPGTIGPDGKLEQPWSQEWVDTFGCWIQQGCPE
jgi:hypothetical protein